MKKSAVINMKDLNIEGNVIDIAAKGNTIVSEIVSKAFIDSKDTGEKDFIAWNKRSLPYEEKIYDYAVAFFSLNTIRNKYVLVRIIRELKRVLKKDGKVIIWDAYEPGIKSFATYELKVLIAEGDIRKVKYRIPFNPFRVGFNSVMDVLERNGFKILNNRIMDRVYYIEAVNTGERK